MAGRGRRLTDAERGLAQAVFGAAIDYDAVEVRHRKWAFFQPRTTVMAPMGHLHFHPADSRCVADFCAPSVDLATQALFIHEMVHVWQAQTRGRWYLILMRHPLCSYTYALKPGWPLHRYGIEQQAEIVRHYFLLSKGQMVAGAPGIEAYRAILPFRPEG